MLTLVQGHPKLLELADAAAADPARLAAQLTAVETAVDGTALTAFLRQGTTALDATQFLRTLAAWTTEAAATLPAPSRLLLQALCRIEETDRDSVTLNGNWADLWRHLDQPGDPPPLDTALAPLIAAALIAAEPADPTDPNAPVRYRIHPGITEAIHTSTPESVTTAVDAELAAFWTAVANWGIEQEQNGTGQLVIRAGLAAAAYLLRQHDWYNAGQLLEQVQIRDFSSPATAQAVIPFLRRIAETTGALRHLSVLATALRWVNPGEAETLLDRAYDYAITHNDHGLASTAAGYLADLLCDQGRLCEALALTDQIAEHTHQAGLGSWTQLGVQAQRLRIVGLLGHHEQVLTDLSALRDRMAELPDQRADNDTVNPWNVRDAILDAGGYSALALGRWQQVLDLNKEVANIRRRRGASAHETTCTRFNDYGPLLELGRLAEVEDVLRECQAVFETVGDITMLANVYFARADLEDRRGHLQDALTLKRTALRLHYGSRQPQSIAASHHNLASYLLSATGTSAEQRAHRLAAAFLNHLTGDTHHLAVTLRELAHELSGETASPGAPPLPTSLTEIIGLIDAGDGVHFGDLVATLCPDPDTANQALADLLATAATLPKEP